MCLSFYLLIIFWVVRIGLISDNPIYPLSYGQSRSIRVVKKAGLLSDRIISGMYFLTFNEPKNRFQGIDSPSQCSLAGRYNNHIPTQFLAPLGCYKFQQRARIFKLLRSPLINSKNRFRQPM